MSDALTKTKDLIELALQAHWGPRCETPHNGCAACAAWNSYDSLRAAPRLSACVEVKPGYEVECRREGADLDHVVPLSEALTTRTVEGVRREVFEEAEQWIRDHLSSELGGLYLKDQLMREDGSTPAPSRETQPSAEPECLHPWCGDKCGTQPDELRKAKYVAWEEGRKFGCSSDGHKSWANPYAAPDEGGGK